MNEYHIDLEKFSLDEFKNKISESELIPSRKMLKDDIDARFKVLKDNNIHNLQDLTNILKTPKKTREFAQKSGLPEDYLLILRREVNSYTPKPVNLEKFPGVEKETVNKLKSAGIKNTAHLFKKVKTPEDRIKLAAELEISEEEILELTKLADLSRIKWVGPFSPGFSWILGLILQKRYPKQMLDLSTKNLLNVTMKKSIPKLNSWKVMLLCVLTFLKWFQKP